jgi:hypothetical protein
MVESPTTVETDGQTVWVNASDGSCVARFGVMGIDIHTSISAQMSGASQCLDCTHGKTSLKDWRTFQVGMRRHYSVGVDDQWMPARIRKELSAWLIAKRPGEPKSSIQLSATASLLSPSLVWPDCCSLWHSMGYLQMADHVSPTTGEPIAIWGGNARLYWRDDSYGKKDRALFIGGLCIGHIMQWTGKDSPKAGEWRAWIMTDDDGRHLGWHPTEQEAKDALVDEAVKELCK